jgi:hypothetical protein
VSIFICDCGKPAPTRRELRVADCSAHADGEHVFVQRREEELNPYSNTLATCPCCGGFPALCNCP